jgi:hypothetical protein
LLKDLKSISFINESIYEELKRNLLKNNYSIYEIDGRNITDLQSFYKNIERLPQDPMLNKEGNVNLDAFLDSLRGGLANLVEDFDIDKVAFL